MITQPPLSLGQVYEGYLRPRQALSEGTSTPKHYLNYIRRFGEFLGRQATLDDLQDDLVWAFIQDVGRRHCARTGNNARDYLLSLWRFANRKGMKQHGPDVPRLTEPEQIPLAFTIEELGRLFWSASQQEGSVCGIRASKWWVAILRSTFDSGERVGAILRWEWQHLDQASGDIYCPANIRKGGRKPKVYRLREAALEAVLAIRQPERKLIFPWNRASNAVYYHFDQILKRAALPCGRKWKFHCIRKSHASYLRLYGGDPTESLGHTSKLTTEAYLSPRILTEERHSAKLPEV